MCGGILGEQVYNEFITPTTFIKPVIGIFNGLPLPIFDVGYTLDSSMPSLDVIAATWLAEVSLRHDKVPCET